MARDADQAVVEVGGVGLLVRVSATTANELPAPGAEVALSTYLAVREDALELFGFATDAERRLFEAFIAISGVGPRVGLALCGVDTPDALRLALVRGDVAKIQRAQGVGKRTAERVVLELRDKVGEIAGPAPVAAAPTADADTFIAARDGLVGLGFGLDDAEAALADSPADADAEALIRHALGRLRR